MKAKLITFILGAACGALGMFFANHDATEPDARSADAGDKLSIHPDREQQKIAALEKKIAQLEASGTEAVAAVEPESGPGGSKSPSVKIFGAGESKIDLMEMREHMEKAEKERSAKRTTAKLASLTKALDLSAEQAEKVRALIEQEEATKSNGLSGIFNLATSAAQGGDAEGLVSGLIAENDEPDPDAFDFDSELLALLDDDQTEAYKNYSDSQDENYIEANANGQLAQLQTTVSDLSKDQKDRAFDEFARIAREDVEGYGAPDEGGGFDLKRMMRQREAEKTAMEEILTPEQLEVYGSSPGAHAISFGGAAGAATIISTDVRIESGEPPAQPSETE